MSKIEVLNRKLDTQNTKKSFKKVAWFYDVWSRLTESKAAECVIEFADIKNGDAVLEVACGTGVVFEQIVKRNPSDRNIGLDLSPDMLRKAKERLKKIPDADYEFQEADTLKLDFSNDTFDTLINNFMVDLMPEDKFDTIAEEFYRIVKPGGKAVISTFSFGKKKINKFWVWAAKYFPELLTGCRPVSFKENLVRAGFRIERNIEISQNTFPSEVIKAVKDN
jgi:ubiquinone/menaquinone biosynthesis C-methylase UbiE